MTAFADIFLRMANEVEVLDTHTFCHCQLGSFRWRSGQDETTQTGTLEGPPPDLWRFIYLHYHADDRAGVEALRRWPRPVISLTEREDPVFTDKPLDTVLCTLVCHGLHQCELIRHSIGERL